MNAKVKVEKQFKCHEINNNSKFFKFIHETPEVVQFIKDALEKFKDHEENAILALKDYLNENIELKTPSNRRVVLRVCGSFKTYISIYPHWIIPNKKVQKPVAEKVAE